MMYGGMVALWFHIAGLLNNAPWPVGARARSCRAADVVYVTSLAPHFSGDFFLQSFLDESCTAFVRMDLGRSVGVA